MFSVCGLLLCYVEGVVQVQLFVQWLVESYDVDCVYVFVGIVFELCQYVVLFDVYVLLLCFVLVNGVIV